MKKHVWSKTSPLLCLFRNAVLLLTGELFVFSHLCGKPLKKGNVIVVCNIEKKFYVECLVSAVFPYGLPCTDLKGVELDITVLCYTLVLVSGQRDLF